MMMDRVNIISRVYSVVSSEFWRVVPESIMFQVRQHIWVEVYHQIFQNISGPIDRNLRTKSILVDLF